MKRLLPVLLVVALVGLVVLFVPGCPKKEPAKVPQPAVAPTKAPTPTPAWSWDPAKLIDPSGIPDIPVVGAIDGQPFEVKYVVLQEHPDEKYWEMRFYDTEPPAGKEGDFSFEAKSYIDLEFVEAGKGVTVDLPVEYPKWEPLKTWITYYRPDKENPDGILVNPGKRAAYVQFTEWTVATPQEDKPIGAAKGKVASGAEYGEKEGFWLAGNFEATICKPW